MRVVEKHIMVVMRRKKKHHTNDPISGPLLNGFYPTLMNLTSLSKEKIKAPVE
jgi:hypothetical protein